MGRSGARSLHVHERLCLKCLYSVLLACSIRVLVHSLVVYCMTLSMMQAGTPASNVYVTLNYKLDENTWDWSWGNLKYNHATWLHKLQENRKNVRPYSRGSGPRTEPLTSRRNTAVWANLLGHSFHRYLRN
jgi:hypothetical protein